LRAHFEAACERFLDWADREMAHRARRDTSLAALRFPYDGFPNRSARRWPKRSTGRLGRGAV
jgi:hypothetical protein